MGAAPISSRNLVALVAVSVALLTAAAGASTFAPQVRSIGLSDGQTVTGSVHWEAVVDNTNAKLVDFYIDDRVRWSERNAPFVFNGNGGVWDTRSESDGPHQIALRMIGSDGQRYWSRITVTVANNGGGPAPPPATDTKSPTAPTGIKVVAATATGASLSWNASSDDVGVKSYSIYRDGQLAGNSTSTSYALGGLACGRTYVVAVDAVDVAGNRSAKAEVTAATAPCTAAPPPPVTTPTETRAVATTGSDSNPCTQAAPCKTFDRAYRAAKPGAVVEVAQGTYPGQRISPDSTKTSSSNVVFRPAAGANVALSGVLEIAAKRLELRDMTFRYRIVVGAQHVTLRNILARGAIRIISDGSAAPSDISILGGEIGPGVDSDSQIGSNGTSTTASPKNILFDGVYFHDFTVSSASSAHVECLQVWAADGLTIRNSRFENCEYFDVFLQKLPGGAAATPSNVLIENNFMDCCGGGFYSIRLSDTHGESWRNVTIRNNSTNKAFSVGPKASYSNVAITSNIAPKLDGAPRPGLAVNYNIWYAGSKIGLNDRVAQHGFRSVTGFDFYLVPGAAAIDRGDPGGSPATDIDGRIRPYGDGPDAGAHESSSAAPAPQPEPPTEPTPTDPIPTDPPPVEPVPTEPAPAAGSAAIFLATTGSDANSCSAAKPCKTLNRAYRLARPGDVVELAGGVYPEQSIGVDPSKTSPDDVVFRPAAGAKVEIAGDLIVLGSHIEFRDLTVGEDWRAAEASKDLTFRNVDAARFYIISASDIRVLGGEIGPSVNKVVQIKPSMEGPPSRNVLVDGVYFHDFYATDPAQHMECIHVMGVDGLTIRNSRFNRCEHFDVFVKRFSSSAGTPKNILIENNWFQKTYPEGHWAVRFSETGPWENVTIRHNSFAQGLSVSENVRLVNFRIEANVGSSHPCHDDARYAYNVWENGTCGATDVQAPTGFADVLQFDFRLVAGAAGVDLVPTSALVRDIDGRPRPSGARYDAGAWER